MLKKFRPGYNLFNCYRMPKSKFFSFFTRKQKKPSSIKSNNSLNPNNVLIAEGTRVSLPRNSEGNVNYKSLFNKRRRSKKNKGTRRR